MLPFLLINVVVSLTVVVAALTIYDRRAPDTPIPVVATTPLDVERTAAAEVVVVATDDVAAEPTQTPTTPQTPTPSGPVIHVVKSGDTMGLISVLYGVPIDEILTANNLLDPNLISIGQELLIPLGGPEDAVTAEVVEDAEDAAAAEPTVPPTATPEPIDLIITGVNEPGVVGAEYVMIVNRGSSSVDFSGWALRNSAGEAYQFGLVTLFGNGIEMRVITGSGQDTATMLYWDRDTPAWGPGETVTLIDTTGAVQATFAIPDA